MIRVLTPNSMMALLAAFLCFLSMNMALVRGHLCEAGEASRSVSNYTFFRLAVVQFIPHIVFLLLVLPEISFSHSLATALA